MIVLNWQYTPVYNFENGYDNGTVDVALVDLRNGSKQRWVAAKQPSARYRSYTLICNLMSSPTTQELTQSEKLWCYKPEF